MSIFVDVSNLSVQEKAYQLSRLIDLLERQAINKTANLSTQPKEETGEEKPENNNNELAEANSEFLKKMKALQDKKDNVEILKVLISKFDFIFELQEKDIEGIMNVLFLILWDIPKNDSSSLSSLELFLNSFLSTTSSSSTKPTVIYLKLKLLNNLYNSYPASSLHRYHIFLAILKFSIANNTSELLLPHLDIFFSEKWWLQWKLSKSQVHDLFLLILNLYESKNLHLKAFKLLVNYFTSSSDIDHADVEITKLSKKAVILAIQLPEIVYCDYVTKLPSIKLLEKTDPKLWGLLEIFASGNLDTFETFVNKNAGFLEEIGLAKKPCLKKMRLLSLASLANQLNAGPQQCEIGYDKISAALKIEESQVEKWVISAISAKVIDAKLDQLRRVVIINWSSQRQFGKAQWEILLSQISNWKNSVASLQTLIREKKQI